MGTEAVVAARRQILWPGDRTCYQFEQEHGGSEVKLQGLG